MKRKHLIILAIGLTLCVLGWIRLRPNTETKHHLTERAVPSVHPVERTVSSLMASAEELAEKDRERLTELNQAIGSLIIRMPKKSREPLIPLRLSNSRNNLSL